MSRRPAVFVAHDVADSAVVAELIAVGQQSNPDISFQSMLGDEEIQDDLFQQYNDLFQPADVIVVVLSQAAVRASWLTLFDDYVTFASLRKRDINVVPFKIEECTPPDDLRNWHAIDATEDRRAAITGMLTEIEDFWSVQPSRLSAFALEMLVQDLLRAYGFNDIQHVPVERGNTPDYAATTTQLDPFGNEETVKWIVEVKKKSSGDVVSLRRLFEKTLAQDVRGIFVTAAELSSPAKEWLERAQRLEGRRLTVLDGPELRRLVLEHPHLVLAHFRFIAEDQ